jgi:hypothetical protein
VEQPEDEDEVKAIQIAYIEAESKPGSSRTLKREEFTAWDSSLGASNEAQDGRRGSTERAESSLTFSTF